AQITWCVAETGRGEQPLDVLDRDRLGQPAWRRRWAYAPRRVGGRQALAYREAMQATDGDDRTGRGARGERGMPLVALAQAGQERHHVVLTDLIDRRTPACDQRVDVSPQVTPVGAEGVGGQAPVEGKVIEVGADLGPQRASEVVS